MPFQIQTVVTFSDQDVLDLIITGVEGGIGYWSTLHQYTPDEFNTVVSEDCDGSEVVPIRLTKEDCYKGLNLMAQKQPRHFDDFVNDNYDAETGDVFIQFCLLGDVVYG